LVINKEKKQSTRQIT